MQWASLKIKALRSKGQEKEASWLSCKVTKTWNFCQALSVCGGVLDKDCFSCVHRILLVQGFIINWRLSWPKCIWSNCLVMCIHAVKFAIFICILSSSQTKKKPVSKYVKLCQVKVESLCTLYSFIEPEIKSGYGVCEGKFLFNLSSSHAEFSHWKD